MKMTNDLNELYKNHSIFDMEETTPLTKETHEGLHDTSQFTKDFKEVLGDADRFGKTERYKKMVEDFRETISCEVTSDWGDNADFTPAEVYMAFKEAITTEGAWFKKHSDRCNELLSLISGHRIVDLE